MTEDERPNPDRLLASLRDQEARGGRGRLKVFLGMCPGVGKTYAMLEAARRELASGRDVAIGYLESHGRPETDALAEGLPVVAPKRVVYRGVELREMDLDALLARRPQLALVDELAHSNVPGSRHPKRWQDVQELLDAGIDVFTTVNVQHIESRADTVRQITGAPILETLPDSVLDAASLELIDLPTTDLLRRLAEGRVYLPERAAAAARSFFQEGNLTALRELALRLVADHVGEDTRQFHRGAPHAGPWKSGHRLLVAVSPSPLSESLVRWTRRMADGLKCPWLAVYVETPRALSEAARAQLSKNLGLARELGADTLSTSDEDVVRGLLRVASDQNVTQIVVGKPGGGRWLDGLSGDRFLRRLAHESGDVDLHVIRAQPAGRTAPASRWRPTPSSGGEQYLWAVGVVLAVGVLNWGLMFWTGPRVPGFVFLLAVLLLGLKVGRGPQLAAGALSALAWNYLFLPPRFTLYISRLEDWFLFATYFVVAVILGQLVARLRAQEQAERQREQRTSALYGLTRDLAEAGSRDEVVWQLIAQVSRVFDAEVAVSLPGGDRLAPHPDSTLVLSDKELAVADWAFRQRKSAGRFTDNLPGAQALHLPLTTERKVFGVLAVRLEDRSLGVAQRDLLEAFTRQAALVLDRVELRNAAEQARLLAESERLSRTLLDSISHELRTPLAASSAATAALAEAVAASPEPQRALLAEIQEANRRLNRIVGNLLDMARLESGRVAPNLDWHEARDVVESALRELEAELAEHPVAVALPPGACLLRVDGFLLQRVLVNLLLNGATHTPPGTSLEVRLNRTEREALLEVADRGPGIPVEYMPRLFDKFFRAPQAAAGGSGLGLTLVKGFVEAHAGTIQVANRPHGGAVITVRLPQPEPPPPLSA